jgi:photosystem II stability/assembly factor-like uncharacterized protein
MAGLNSGLCNMRGLRGVLLARAALAPVAPGLVWGTVTLPVALSGYGPRMVISGSTIVAFEPFSSQFSRSTDDGATWSIISPSPNARVHTGAANGNNFVIATDANNAGLRSTDGGVNWSAFTMPSAGYGSMVASGSTFIATQTASTQLARSTDNGANWSNISIPVGAYYRGIAANGNTFVAVCYDENGVLRSTDGGATWSFPRTLGSFYRLHAIAANGSTFVAVANNNSGFVTNFAVRSTDDGATWSPITLPFSARWVSIAAIGNTFIAIPDSGTSAARSTDGGLTWSTITLATSSPVYIGASPSAFLVSNFSTSVSRSVS